MSLKELATESQKFLNIQVLKLTNSYRTSGTDSQGWESVSRCGKREIINTVLCSKTVCSKSGDTCVGSKIHQ